MSGQGTMAREYGELVRKRIARDPAFREALPREGADTLLAGDVDRVRRSDAT
jgi:hypothetical protein